MWRFKEKMTLKEQTLAHYDRMIKWVEKQDPDDTPISLKMLDEIKENWQGDYCPLCNKFFKCSYCPIAKMGHECCFETPWTKLANAKTWKEWLDGAREEIAFIESLEF